MSRKTTLIGNMKAFARACGGAHLTHEARGNTISMFAAFAVEVGYTHMQQVADIGVKHIRAYVEVRLAAGISKRSLHNEMAHLRAILKRAGCFPAAWKTILSNKSLGLSGTSRQGTKVALSVEEYEGVRALALVQGRPGMAALVGLGFYLGLRANEAIHARTDTLERWLRELRANDTVEVLAGAKGGRSRIIHPVAVEAAIHMVEEALAVAKHQGGYLVLRASGRAAGGLKEARSIYHGWAHRAGFEPHAARYAFAQCQIDGYIARGFAQREAFIATARDLGHGDGRGRFIRSVYGRRS